MNPSTFKGILSRITKEKQRIIIFRPKQKKVPQKPDQKARNENEIAQ